MKEQIVNNKKKIIGIASVYLGLLLLSMLDEEYVLGGGIVLFIVGMKKGVGEMIGSSLDELISELRLRFKISILKRRNGLVEIKEILKDNKETMLLTLDVAKYIVVNVIESVEGLIKGGEGQANLAGQKQVEILYTGELELNRELYMWKINRTIESAINECRAMEEYGESQLNEMKKRISVIGLGKEGREEIGKIGGLVEIVKGLRIEESIASNYILVKVLLGEKI